ncbi:hypothetical protein TrVE_jg11950 [Triparma verrucosa]|uniref:Uridine kinase n=2 Tax=Triparma TaxID=722752 RepID=A0A9W7ECN0_9STRA|nr:hypothetical protein TrST_g1968 [Triparma strigata]GMH98627.1 hypothetical protein TrVE_jg11950 [Triparma verrucosa]
MSQRQNQNPYIWAGCGLLLGVSMAMMIQHTRLGGSKNATAPSPGSPLSRAALSRRMSDPLDGRSSSPSSFNLGPSNQDPASPKKFQNLRPDPHTASHSFSPLIGTIREISNRPDGAPILVVGIAGGSGSGKTTLAQAIYTALGRENNVTFISHDSYYKDLSSWTMAQREQQNFDHPNSLDTDLLVGHIEQLRSGSSVLIPNYDFSTHSRTAEKTVARPRRVILVEGILIFTEPRLTELLDVKIFVDTESDVRLIRRVTRDCQERGRSLDQVLDQYMRTVRPMHNEFVEPSKRQADIIVPVGINSVALSLITDHLKTALVEATGVQYLKTPFDEENKRERGAMSREVSAERLDLMNE